MSFTATIRGSPCCRGSSSCPRSTLVDTLTADAARGEWVARLQAAGLKAPVLLTSAVSHAGLDALAAELVRRVPEAPAGGERGAMGAGGADAAMAEHRVFRPAAPRRYSVRRTGEGSFQVTGEGIERLLARYDLDNGDALAHLERRLKGIGVLRALEAEGFRAGDEVEIAGVAFDLDPSV